jgi:hypothetical protein
MIIVDVVTIRSVLRAELSVLALDALGEIVVDKETQVAKWDPFIAPARWEQRLISHGNFKQLL